MPNVGWRKKFCKAGHDRTDPDNIYLWGGYAFCRACRGTKSSAWHRKAVTEKSESYPIRKFENALRRKYGLTLDQYHALCEKQDFCCAICGSIERLVVDHNHETGNVRGLLCGHCNGMLGFAKDSAVVLRNAARYCEVIRVGS